MSNTVKFILIGLISSIAIIPVWLRLIKLPQWYFRMADFPLFQLLIINLLLLIFIIIFYKNFVYFKVIIVILIASICNLSYNIFPYTSLSKKEVVDSNGIASNQEVSILTANVLTPNKKYIEFLELVANKNPDLVLTLETDILWQQKIDILEEQGYTYSVKIPKDNLYGMHLYSKFPLKNVQERYLVTKDIPSIKCLVEMDNGLLVELYCIHPEPPNPNKTNNTIERDAELLMIAKEVYQSKYPVIVAGDLNDVAWSYTTKLFQQNSGLLDPRKGRGVFNTYNAKIFFMRWPLDHVFHSKHFSLKSLERLSDFGSDHFPLFAKLQISDVALEQQESLEKTKESTNEANERIDELDEK